jgi:hypothetical protein
MMKHLQMAHVKELEIIYFMELDLALQVLILRASWTESIFKRSLNYFSP